ncbi:MULTISPECIES: hypothetical protein [unclassified Streptomyces]|uniref:hypothetical protein n=1 Tax=unclassified Streptomyces TaxID=2593676 RepID=UPI003664562E
MGLQEITESTAPKAERLDLMGVLLSALAVVLIVFPLTEGHAHQWPLWCFAMLAAGLAVLGVFPRQQRRRQDDAPLVVLALFRKKAFSGGLSAQMTFGLLSGMFLITWTLFLQRGLGMSPLQAALAFVLLTVGEMGGVLITMKAAGRYGRRLPQAGALIALVATAGYGLQIRAEWAGESARAKQRGCHPGGRLLVTDVQSAAFLSLGRGTLIVGRLRSCLAEERQQGPGRQGVRVEELRGQSGRHRRSLHADLSWQVKQNAASNSARSRESSYARTLQPGEKPQRCCSLPGRLSIKARAAAASLPAQWATAVPGYGTSRLVGRAEIRTTSISSVAVTASVGSCMNAVCPPGRRAG